jgi:hypothetical protein
VKVLRVIYIQDWKNTLKNEAFMKNRTTMTSLTVITLFFLICSCVTKQTRTVDKNIEGKVTIDHGIYGLTYSVNDIGNTDESIFGRFKIIISGIENGDTLFVDSLRSDENGFYEYPLPSGSYKLCSGFMRCVIIDIGSEIKRCDYEFSVGPGWQCGEMCR